MDAKYIEFFPQEQTGKTGIWLVRSKRNGTLLGGIRWYGPWRQYCFFPERDCVFNRGCLEDINSFIRDQMEGRRLKRTLDKTVTRYTTEPLADPWKMVTVVEVENTGWTQKQGGYRFVSQLSCGHIKIDSYRAREVGDVVRCYACGADPEGLNKG